MLESEPRLRSSLEEIMGTPLVQKYLCKYLNSALFQVLFRHSKEHMYQFNCEIDTLEGADIALEQIDYDYQ